MFVNSSQLCHFIRLLLGPFGSKHSMHTDRTEWSLRSIRLRYRGFDEEHHVGSKRTNTSAKLRSIYCQKRINKKSWGSPKTYQITGENTSKVPKAPQGSTVADFIGNIFGNQARAEKGLAAGATCTSEKTVVEFARRSGGFTSWRLSSDWHFSLFRINCSFSLLDVFLRQSDLNESPLSVNSRPKGIQLF